MPILYWTRGQITEFNASITVEFILFICTLCVPPDFPNNTISLCFAKYGSIHYPLSRMMCPCASYEPFKSEVKSSYGSVCVCMEDAGL